MKRFSKAKYTKKVITKELFLKWQQNFPEFKHIEFKTYKKIAKDLLLEYKNEILTNPHGVRLPFYMGDMDLKYVPMKRPPLNPEASKATNTEVPYLNFGTNGRVGKIVHSVDHCRKWNKYAPILGFHASREFIMDAKAQLKENPEIFMNSRATVSNRFAMIKKESQNKLNQCDK